MILPVLATRIDSNISLYSKNRKTVITQDMPEPCSVNEVQKAYAVPFLGHKNNVSALRKLIGYKLPDMYLGQIMLDPKVLESMQRNGVFNYTLDKLVPILKKYEKNLLPVAKSFVKMLENTSKEHPDIKIDDAVSLYFKEHEKKLLELQEPILFEELTEKACDMPKVYFDDFMELMNITNQKISNDTVIDPFSEKTFIYQLTQASYPIRMKNKRYEVSAINNLIREAKATFIPPLKLERTLYGRNRAKKLEYQRRPDVLKENSRKFQYLKSIFLNSPLKYNKDLIRIFNSTSAKIYGKSTKSAFKRKEFIYDLKKITKFLDDEKLAEDMIKTARKLPTSTENLSAFIVKHNGDSCEKIGFYLLKESLASIEHIVPKINGGKNRLSNYGLCCVYINSKRSNMPFADWVRQNPMVYINCQKYFNRLIELYNNGTFKKLGLDRSYITDLSKTIYNQSPPEAPIIINLSSLKRH